MGCSGEGCVTGCPENWEEHGGHCYLWDDKARSWYKAEEFCKNEGGHLASVTSEAANEYIFEGKEKRKHANIWLGGSDQEEEGVWKWSDGTPWNFQLWNQGEPSNQLDQDCLIQFGLNVKEWNDYPCNYERNFVCSKTPYSGKNGISVSESTTLSLSLYQVLNNKKKGAAMTQDARKAGRRTEIIVTSGAQCLRLGIRRRRFAKERVPTWRL